MPRIPPVGRRFKKGQTGNPAGSSAKVREAAAMARLRPQLAKVAPTLTPENLKLLISGIFMGSVGDVKATQKELGDDVLLLYQGLTNCISTCVKKGDVAGFLKLIEYVTGRAPDKLEISGPDGGPVRTGKMSNEDIAKELADIRARRKKQS